VIVLLLLACSTSPHRFADDLALHRTLAAIDRDRDGAVPVGEIP
jgi:hypothetical protein